MRRILILASAMLISMSTISAAQQSDTDQGRQPGFGMMGPGMMGYGGMGPGMMGRYGMMGPGMMMGYGPTMEGQLAYVKAELGITDAQKEAWDAYVSAIKSRADTMQSMHSAMVKAMQTGSALERMEARTNAMQSMVESMKAIKPATEHSTKFSPMSKRRKPTYCSGTAVA